MVILRNAGAVLLGMVVGSAANMGVLMVSWSIWPMPADLDLADTEAFAAWIGTLPAGAFLFAIAAHLAQAGLGGWIAARVGASRPLALALTVGALTMVGGLMNLVQLPAPYWMWLEVPLYLLVAWMAGQAEERRRDNLSRQVAGRPSPAVG